MSAPLSLIFLPPASSHTTPCPTTHATPPRRHTALTHQPHLTNRTNRHENQELQAILGPAHKLRDYAVAFELLTHASAAVAALVGGHPGAGSGGVDDSRNGRGAGHGTCVAMTCAPYTALSLTGVAPLTLPGPSVRPALFRNYLHHAPSGATQRPFSSLHQQGYDYQQGYIDGQIMAEGTAIQ